MNRKKIEKIECLEDVIEIASIACNKFRGRILWWRGHEKTNWKLRPKSIRKVININSEENMIRQFKLKALTRHHKCPHSDDEFGWLSIMQHYGVPTRLLDWTESPLIATFFAVEKMKGIDGALWCLNPARLNNEYVGESVLYEGSALVDNNLIGKELDNNGHIVAAVSREFDAREMMQLSTFTVHQSTKPLDKHKTNEEFLAKFEISKKAKESIIRQLEKIGITRSNLFPDLESLANQISDRYWKPERSRR